MLDYVAPPDFLGDVMDAHGIVELDRLTEALRVTKADLAYSAGLPREAVSKTARLNAPATQARLRDVAVLINRILPWCASVPQAFAWYRSQPIPAFGDQTAEDLVRAGRAAHVMSYLGGIAAGGYA